MSSETISGDAYQNRFAIAPAIAWDWLVAATRFGPVALLHSWFGLAFEQRLEIAGRNLGWCILGAFPIGMVLVWKTDAPNGKRISLFVEWLLWNYLLASLIYMQPSVGINAVE